MVKSMYNSTTFETPSNPLSTFFPLQAKGSNLKRLPRLPFGKYRNDTLHCNYEERSDDNLFVIASLNALAFRRGNLIFGEGIVIHSIKE